MLKSITLKNWRSHKDSTLNFAKGTDIIVGRMGGGKSSVIDAICFALFGTCPAIQHRRLKVGDYIRSRPDGAKEAEITLVFEHKGEEYSIKRIIKKTGTTEGEVRKDGRMIEGPQPAKATEFIEGMLDVNYDLFTRAIYSEQNRIDYFLTLPKGERKRQIDELIGLDRFEEVRKNATTAAGRIKVMYEDKRSIIKSFDIERTKIEISGIEEELKALDEEIAKTKAQLSNMSGQKKEMKIRFDELESARIKYTKLNEKLSGLKHSMDMLEKDLKESKFDESEFLRLGKDIEKLREKKQGMQKDYDMKDKELSIISRKSGELGRSEMDLEERIARKEKLLISMKGVDRGEIEKDLRSNEAERERFMQVLADGKAMVSDFEKAIIELEREIGRCPVCDSELPEEKRRELKERKTSYIEATKKEMEETKQKQTEIEKNIKSLKDKLRAVDETFSRLKEFEGIEEKKEKIRSEKRDNDSKLDSLKAEKEKFAAELNGIAEEYNSMAKRFERMRELKSKQEKYAIMKSELKEVEEDVTKTKFNEDNWKKARKELEEATLDETRITGELNAKLQKEKFENEKLNDREKRLKEIEKYEEEIRNYEENIEKLQLFSNAIIETQQALREELVAAINEALGEIWGILYPYSDYPIVKIQPSESDYDLVFKVGEEWISVDGIASGGERALACLALKVSFAMVLTPNLSWLILDEPTHNLDEEAVRTLAVTLHDHIPKIVEQTFVVTHDENLRDAASGKLFRIERNKDMPEISNVEEITV